MQKPALKVRNLEKSYDKKLILKGMSFAVAESEIYCILGPNGAGKSTLIHTLCGLLPFSRGTIEFFGLNINQDAKKIRQNIGVVPQDIALYEELTALQNVKFFGSLYGYRGGELMQQCEKALEFVGVRKHQNDVVNRFSGGMKRRLNIACALVHNPRLVIMDEPTVGIDPQSRNHILDSIRKLSASGVTIIYSTHYMEEVEAIASNILIVDEGEILIEGTKEALKSKIIKNKELAISVNDTAIMNIEDLKLIVDVVDISIVDKHVIKIIIKNNADNFQDIIQCLHHQKIKINAIMSNETSLETVFLELTGKKLRD